MVCTFYPRLPTVYSCCGDLSPPPPPLVVLTGLLMGTLKVVCNGTDHLSISERGSLEKKIVFIWVGKRGLTR